MGLKIVVLMLVFRLAGDTDASVLSAGMGVLKASIDIFGAASQVVDFFEKRDTPVGVTQAELDKLKTDILQQMDYMLSNYKGEIILALTLQEEVGRLKETTSRIQSSLEDLKNLMLARNKSEETIYKALFKQRYEEHDIIVEIRKLAGLLTETIPELSKPLKDLILDSTKCNMTAIVEFEKFYARLISDAVTLQLVYGWISNHSSYFVQQYWDTKLPYIQTTFQDMENVCIATFDDYVDDDVKLNVSTETIFDNSKQRYPWKTIDVFDFPPKNSFKYHYHRSLPQKCLFWNDEPNSFRNRIMVMLDKDIVVPLWNQTDVQAALQRNISLFKKSINGPLAAQDLYKATERFVNDLNFIHKALIVFYVPPEPESFVKTILDPLSIAAHLAVPDNAGGFYHAYVYPEIWNNFSSYLNSYTGNKEPVVSAAVAWMHPHHLSTLEALCMVWAVLLSLYSGF